MKSLCLAGLVAVLVLAISPILVAQDDGGTTPAAAAHQRRGAGAGGGAAAKGAREQKQPIVLNADQQAALQPLIDKLTADLAELKAKAQEQLGQKEGDQFVREAVMKAARPAGAERGARTRGAKPEKAGTAGVAKKPRGEGRKKAGAGGGDATVVPEEQGF